MIDLTRNAKDQSFVWGDADSTIFNVQNLPGKVEVNDFSGTFMGLKVNSEIYFIIAEINIGKKFPFLCQYDPLKVLERKTSLDANKQTT